MPTVRWDENERLAALHRYAVLDTPREAEFDDIVRLASDVFDAPISVVNLIASGRQWFKAEIGIGADELPLDVSICAHAILQPGIFVVPDTTKDPRFDCNPLVTGEPGLRFYAGALLETPEGLPLGTVCVLDTEARPEGITDQQRLTLEVLARQVMTQLELRLAVAERDAEVARSRASEERLRLVLDGARDYAIFTIDPERRITSFSAGAEATFNLSAAQAIGRSADELFTIEDRAAGEPEREVETASKTGCANDERWHRRADGSRVFLNGSVHPLPRDEAGRERGFIKVARDETAQRAAHQAVREAEERYRLAARATNDVIWDWHLATNYVLWNEALETAYDYAPADVEPTGEWWIAHIHPDDRARVKAGIHAAIDGMAQSWTDEYRFRRADDSYAEVLDRGHIIRDTDGCAIRMIGAMLDMTHRRRAEAALAVTEERLRLAVDNAEVGFWDVDQVHDVLIWPPRTKAMFGIAADAPVTMEDFYEGLHPGDREATSVAYAAAADPARRALYDVEYRTVGKEDGIVRWVAAKGRGIFDPDERCIRVAGTAIDITERKRAEARQQFQLALADRLRSLSEPREIVAAAVELLGRHLNVSRVGYGEYHDNGASIDFETDYADGVAHLVGTFPADNFGPGNMADLRRGITTTYADVEADPRTAGVGFAAIGTRSAMAVPLIRGGRLRAVLYLNHREVREWLPDEVAHVGDVAARTWDALERARAEAAVRELNATLEARVEERTRELREAEEALRQSQKMEAVGQLTGGIAHDFNNMLAVVIGSLDLLTRRIGAGDPRAKRYADAAIEGARRAALLTQRLLAFSRQQPLKPEPVNVNKLVAGMSDLLRHSLGGDVRLEAVLAGGLWQTHADPNQLENVILNVAINARDAMPEGGRLTIETQNAHLDARYAALQLGVSEGQYVLVALTDTGIGMPSEVIAKAFDPFFTTKGVGKGTGLGLSQVYGFVKQSGGHVKIYSEPGQGTTIKIYLPRRIGAQAELSNDTAAKELPLGEHREVVLVVEDEPAVRQFSVDALTELCYRVLEADGATAALRLLDAHPEIALMFTDVVMPDVNGTKLAEEARRHHPDLKVLFTTGYTRNAVVHNGVLDSGVELIGKPFTIEELAAKVRAVLDSPNGKFV